MWVTRDGTETYGKDRDQARAYFVRKHDTASSNSYNQIIPSFTRNLVCLRPKFSKLLPKPQQNKLSQCGAPFSALPTKPASLNSPVTWRKQASSWCPRVELPSCCARLKSA